MLEVLRAYRAAQTVSDDESRAVRVREDDEPALLGHAPEQGELILIFEYAEPVGCEDCGIDERLESDLVVPPLDDNGLFDLKHGGSPSRSGSEIP